MQVIGQAGVSQECKILSQFTQVLMGVQFQGGQNPLCISKQVAQHGHLVVLQVFKKQGRAIADQAAVAQFGHLEHGRDRLGNGFQLSC